MLAALGALCTTMATPSTGARAVATPGASPRPGGSVAIAFPYGTPDCLDPQKTALIASSVIFSSVVDTLFSADDKGQIWPDLATGYAYNSGGTELTISLRRGVRFSNGDPFDAAAVKYTFDRAVAPATKSPLTAGNLASVASTRVVDPHTVRLTLKAPYRPLLTQLALPFEGILDPKAPPTCQNVVGTGSFKIQDVGPAYNTVTVARNPTHTFETPWAYNKGPAYLDRITFRAIPSDATRVSELLGGGVDISDIAGSQLGRVKGNGGIAQHRILSRGSWWLGYNTAHAPFDRVEVRRAVAQAIDRSALAAGPFGGLAVPSYSLVGSAMPFYDKNAPSYAPRYDVAAAQKALAGGAATRGRYTLLTQSGPQNTQLSELIQAELAQVGLNATIVTKPIGEYLPLAEKGQYDLLVLAYDYPDPDFLYQLLHSSQGKGAGLNFTGYRSATLDSLIIKGRTATDRAQAAAAYAQIQRLIDTDVIVDPLVTTVYLFGARSRVQGWHASNATSILYQDLYVNP